MKRKFEDEMERDLRGRRPTPEDDYVASIADSIRGSRRSSSSRPRLVVGVALSVVALASLAASGGLSQATAAPVSVAKIVKNVVSNKKDKPAKATKTAANDQYVPRVKCNSGRGNGSEGPNGQLIDPHNGGTGPGVFPTIDCDPGNSGPQNRGGD